MGDKISFSFVNDNWESIAYFDHWGGKYILPIVEEYYKWLVEELGDRRDGMGFSPIDRLEPCTVMLDFIRWKHKDDELIDSRYYLGKDGDDGDNSDNGHWVFDLEKGKWRN